MSLENVDVDFNWLHILKIKILEVSLLLLLNEKKKFLDYRGE